MQRIIPGDEDKQQIPNPSLIYIVCMFRCWKLLKSVRNFERYNFEIFLLLLTLLRKMDNFDRAITSKLDCAGNPRKLYEDFSWWSFNKLN